MLAAGAVGAVGVLGGTATAIQDDGNGTSDGEMPGEGEAAVALAHLAPDAPAVDVLLDGTTVVSGLEYGTLTDYLTLEAGTYTVELLPAMGDGGNGNGGTDDGSDNGTDDGNGDGGDAPDVLYETEVTVEATFQTIAAIGEVGAGTFETVVLSDYDVAQVRLVHASPGAPAVDVTVADTNLTLFDDVSFGDSTDYVAVPGGDYELEVRVAEFGNAGEVVGTFEASVESGMAYSVFAAGKVGDEDTPFQLLPRVDGVTAMADDDGNDNGDDGMDDGNGNGDDGTDDGNGNGDDGTDDGNGDDGTDDGNGDDGNGGETPGDGEA
jgi:hypothetical protein